MRTSIVALVLAVVSLFATQVGATNRVKWVNKPADMRGRFEHALRFHEKGLAKLEAAKERVDAKSASEPRAAMLYGQLRQAHEQGVAIAKTGLRLVNQAPQRVAREDAHAEAAARMAETMSEWRAVSERKRTVTIIGSDLDGTTR